MITEKHQQRFDTVVKTLAQPYALDREFKFTKISYPQGFSTSAGLMSTVLDMAKYDIAIDQNKFLKKETQQLAFTPTVSTKGESLPYGSGLVHDKTTKGRSCSGITATGPATRLSF